MQSVPLSTLGTLSLSIAALVFATPALAAGGDIVLRTDNGSSGYYYHLSGSGEDRFVSEYLADTYSPLDAVICGARIRELNQGTIPPPGEMDGELRFEDPANPGYPDLSPGGLIATIDPESRGPCSRSAAIPRFFTFGRGAGVSNPFANHYICAIEPLHGTAGTLDFCGILLDTSSAPQGFSKVYSQGSFGSIPWNHFVELVVFLSEPFALDFRPHGSARIPGDPGRPIVLSTRPNAGGLVTDDAVSFTITIDNTTGSSIARNLDICADRSVFQPFRGLSRLSGALKTVGGGEGIRNPVVFPEGRSVLRLELPIDSFGERLARNVDRRVVNLPLRALGDDPAADTSPCTLEGRQWVNEKTARLGLRRRAGSLDDNSAESFFVVQAPSAPGDALNVRHQAIDLPRTVPFTVTGFEAVGGEFGGAGLPGLDAIELRSEDPVFTRSPDLTSQGLIRSFGAADGIGEARFPDLGAAAVFDVADLRMDPTGPIGLVANLYVVGLLLPGETWPVTTIGADQAPGDTLLGDSSFTTSGVLPSEYDETSNYMLRLLIDGDRATLEGPPPPATVSPHAFLRRVGEIIAIDHKTGRRIR